MDERQVALLLDGVPGWNAWRQKNPNKRPDLSGADLSGARLSRADLSDTNLYQANLSRANLVEANLFWSNLSEANLSEAKLCRANLSAANLVATILVKADLRGADLSSCWIYGLAAWDVQLDEAIQKDLIINLPRQPELTVDDLEVAQFIYLLLNSKKIRQVIDTITSKVVLILGRFTPDRKPVLDAIRMELRTRNYVPMLFDFDKPISRDITETVVTLAHISRFIIADVTDAKSIPQELMAVVPHLPSVPVQPLVLASQVEYAMFEHIQRFSWVLNPFRYDTQEELLCKLNVKVIDPAEAWIEKQRPKG